MLLDMRDWIQLQGGVYLHVSDARLVIVLGELLLSWDQAQEVLGVPHEYWHCQLLALLCRLYPSIERACVTLRSTVVIERCDYVV